MSKISHTVQIIMDLFYQSYTSDESFFQAEHFHYIVGSYYNSLLVADYEKSKAENIADTGYRYPSFSSGMMVNKKYPVKADDDFKYFEIGEDVVTFPYDNRGYGVQNLRCYNRACGNFTRTEPSMKKRFCLLPFTDEIWWWVEKDRVYMYSAAQIPSEITATIIPAIKPGDEDFFIPQSYESQIINGVLGLFKQAAQGAVVDVANNSNPNEVMQTVVDSVLRNLKTKAQ